MINLLPEEIERQICEYLEWNLWGPSKSLEEFNTYNFKKKNLYVSELNWYMKKSRMKFLLHHVSQNFLKFDKVVFPYASCITLNGNLVHHYFGCSFVPVCLTYEMTKFLLYKKCIENELVEYETFNSKTIKQLNSLLMKI